MHSFVMGLFYLIQSIGGLLGAGLFAAFMTQSKWMAAGAPTDAELANLENYFFVLAGIAFLTWVVFVFVSYRVRIPYSRNSPVFNAPSRGKNKPGKEEPSYASIT